MLLLVTIQNIPNLQKKYGTLHLLTSTPKLFCHVQYMLLKAVVQNFQISATNKRENRMWHLRRKKNSATRETNAQGK
jgi:hypothetical protein